MRGLEHSTRRLTRRGLVAAGTVAAPLLGLAAQPLVAGSAPSLPFLLAIAVLAWCAGPRPALAGLALSTLALLLLAQGIGGPPSSLAPLPQALALGSFLAVGAIVIHLASRLQRLDAEARRLAREKAEAESAAQAHAQRLEPAEAELARQMEVLELTLNLVPVGVAISHDERGDRITVTPRFARFLGLEPNQNGSMSGAPPGSLPYRCLRNGVELPGEEQPMQVASRTGREVRDVELDLVFEDGRVHNMLVSAAPLFDAEGKVRGAVGTLVDVTRIKQAQLALEQADRQKNDFVATLAHELRSPLAPIRYAAELLKPDMPPALFNQARDMIRRQVAQMSHLLDDVLDMSRVTRNIVQLRRDFVDLGRIVETAVAAAQPEILAAGHRLTVALCSGPLVVYGDETRLRQVVGNLLDNARKYTDPGGTIELVLERDGDSARLRVRDSGIGIDPAKLPKVFDMFAQTHARGTGGVSGLGIGLAVVKRLVELHGGSIEAHSDGIGRGAEFGFRLPLAGAAHAPAAARDEKVVGLFHSDARVLVVDDNADAADSLAMLLRMHGMHVTVAYDGVTALELAQGLRPTVVLLDLGLPRLSGEEVVWVLRSQPWGDGLCIVGITGWGQFTDRARTADAGFDAHLVKPVEPAELLSLLGSLLRPNGTARSRAS